MNVKLTQIAAYSHPVDGPVVVGLDEIGQVWMYAAQVGGWVKLSMADKSAERVR